MKIAVIDDDVYIGDMLEELLRREGYQVLRAYSGTEALLLLTKTRPDLILLDLMLPGRSGEDVLSQIRGIPVIILSAKADVQDKVKLLLGGAVDYVTKPFDTGELLARISVQLRNAALYVSHPVLTFEDLTLHVDTHQVQHGEHMIRLTKTEYAILKLLLQNPVVETPSVYLELTAQENIREQYRVLGLPDFAGVTELLKLVGLSDTGNKKIKNFSLGMRQRLGIAIALAGDPDFLVLDEPVNGLDPQGIIEIRELILKLNREHQITFLISSHILDELSSLATHYGFIDNGHMVKEINAEELEAACRKCMRLKVTDAAVLARVLDRMGLEYTILDDGQADIFGSVNITKLAVALEAEHCEITSLHEHDESLESYYVSLMGGDSRE